MRTPKFLRLALLAAVPFALFADEKMDRHIEEAAKTSYTFRRVLGNEIEVKVRDGVATLNGHVRDMDQSRLAEDTVAGIDGVKRVDNRVKVDPKAKPVTDEWLTVKIRSKLLVKPGVSLTHTKVAVKDGIVTLTGVAESEAQKALTESAIKEVAGVRQVRNFLNVDATAAAALARRSPAEKQPKLPPGAGLPTGRTTITETDQQNASEIEDQAIGTQVKFELMANRETSALKSAVSVESGRVVITGEAATEGQRDLVTRIARAVNGVTAVENRMSIKHP